MQDSNNADKLFTQILSRLDVLEKKIDSIIAANQASSARKDIEKAELIAVKQALNSLRQGNLDEKRSQYLEDLWCQVNRNADKTHEIHHLWDSKPSLKLRLNSICRPISEEKTQWDWPTDSWDKGPDFLHQYEMHLFLVLARFVSEGLHLGPSQDKSKQTPQTGNKK